MIDKLWKEHIPGKFVFKGYEDELKEHLISLLKEYGFSYDDEKVDLLIKLLEQIPRSNISKYIMGPGDYIYKRTTICGREDPYVVRLLISIPRTGTRYFINIRKTAIVIIAFLIDFFIARGVTTLTLTLLGQINKTIFRLNDKELIILKTIKDLKRNNKCVTLRELIKELAAKPITSKEIVEIVEKLKSNDIILVKGVCLEIAL